MTDIRESILARLLEVAAARDGMTALRNDPKISDTKLPAIVIFDADEETPEPDPSARPPASASRRVTMTPEIHIVVADDAANVGATLNARRAELLKAIMEDAQLQNLTINREGIAYLGCATALGAERTMQGAMSLRIGFTYLLKPSDL